jgi:uncharacterized protein (TIGR03083 family)
MKPVEPLDTVELFLPLHQALLTLLRNLSDEDWLKPTAAPLWTVKDIVAHLLDGNIRRLSLQRDGLAPLQPETRIASYRDLVAFLNQLNADWVKAARRISPGLLIDFLALTGPQVCDLFKTLDPSAPAIFAVAWAGEDASPNWFDVAREYTEKWHHQQQIRDAVGAPGLTATHWLHPVLDTFMRGLPHCYRAIDADAGTGVTFVITGEAGGTWSLHKEPQGWRLYEGASANEAAYVRLNQDTAWRLFTKGLNREEARSRLLLEGDETLGRHLLDLVAVMA